jgi:sugar/nucleoside kinase (ribokinase family)
MCKKYAVCGIGNALVDLLIRVDQADFMKLGLKKAEMALLDSQQQAVLLNRMADHHFEISSGGSVANSIVALAQLGSSAAFIGTLGRDQYGDVFASQFSELGIELNAYRLADQPTGTCLAIITPDAERTMCTCLGASGSIVLDQSGQDLIRDSQWLVLEGFTLTNSEVREKLIVSALETAINAQTKVAFSFSEAWVVDAHRDAVRTIVARSDLIFCNEAEAKKYTATDTLEEAFAKLKDLCSGVVATAGSQGALIWYGGHEVRVPASQATPVDLTGAGDMFAGTFLHGIISRTDLDVAARRACYMARLIIEQVGARLKQEIPPDFFESIAV